MGLPVQDQLKYWSIAAILTGLALWYLGNVMLPFILGGAIAYFLDPVADRLEDMGCSRTLATTIIAVVAIMIFLLMAFLVIPTLIQQAINLFNTAPDVASNLRDFLLERFPEVMQEDSAIRQSLISAGETIKSRGGELINGLLSSAAGVINILMLLVIVPVVAFYLLLDWDNMVARIDELLPRDHVDTIRQIARDIDTTLAGFVRGMGTVCLILGTYYAIALMTVGLQFGLVVGAIAGLITFIPYLGSLIGGALAIGLAIFQYWNGVEVTGADGTVTYSHDWFRMGIVAAIFMIGQVVEGNYLTPKLVGNSVGLHPVWLLLSLSVFGAIFGFVGLLVAVPVAAGIGVLIRFGVGEYQRGRLYQGQSADQENIQGDDA